MLIRRHELRMALTAGLGNAFASLSGLPFGYYVPLAVLAVGLGSYGGTLALGRQRILGSVLGAALLVVGFQGLRDVPMPLALAIMLAALRLLGGALRLEVGYKVGGMIVVMGWLVHGGQLDRWLGLRLGWTVFGVVLALLSLQLFWPSRALEQAWAGNAALLAELQRLYGELADRVDPARGTPPDPAAVAKEAGPAPADERYRALRGRLMALRRQRPELEEELGLHPTRHPAFRLLQAFDRAGSRLVNAAGEMMRRPPPLGDSSLVHRLHRAEADLLRSLVERMGRWQQRLDEAHGRLPHPPAEPFPQPDSWCRLEVELRDPRLNAASLERLEHLAARLMLCRLAAQSMREAEREWRTLAEAA
jgi:uncharacterized membrane protein YccC